MKFLSKQYGGSCKPNSEGKKKDCDDSCKAYSLWETTCNQLRPGGILHFQESLGFLHLEVLASE